MNTFTRTLILGTLQLLSVAFAQVTKLNNNSGLEFCTLLDANHAIFRSFGTNTLWITDGTPAGTQQITSKVTFDAFGTVLNGRMYFRGYAPATGYELWATDGTDAGTVLVQDINPGAASSKPADRFLLFNNQLYFSAETAAAGRELWKSDGTNAGTLLVKDIVEGTGSSNSENQFKLAVAGNQLFFVANTTIGKEVWKTDGTAANTMPVRDINLGSPSADPIMLGTYQGKLIFSANDGEHGQEPWISDGTLAGTIMIKDIEPGGGSSVADQFVELNGKMILACSDNAHGQELWISDGTTQGTYMLKDIYPGIIGSMPSMFNSIVVNDKLLFAAFSEDHGLELWQTDGTTNGTSLFIDIEPGKGISNPFIMRPFLNGYTGFDRQLFQGNKFFFSAFSGTTGFELYISDGTVAGTRIVKDINQGLEDGLIGPVWYYTKDFLYLNAMDNSNGDELWRTDGITGNTQLVANINATPGLGSNVTPLVIVNNRLLLTADDGDNPTTQIHDLYAFNSFEQPLPIRITRFTGAIHGAQNLLSWTVADAVHFSRFEVLRSTDGAQFQPAGTVVYKQGVADYHFADTDLKTETGTYYYKLRLINETGTAQYTSVVKLTRTGSVAQHMLATAQQRSIRLSFQLREPGAQVLVHDLQGRRLQSANLTSAAGAQSISLPPTQPNAIVLVSIYTTDGQVLTQKVAVL